jgi:Polysaccharide lyase
MTKPCVRWSSRAVRRTSPLLRVAVLVLPVALAVLAAPGDAANVSVAFDGTTKAAWALDQSATPTRVTQLSGFAGISGPVLRFTADANDVAPRTPTDNPRAQLDGPSNIRPGAVVWESWRMFLPQSFPDVPAPAWIILVTPAYGPPYAGLPPLTIAARDTSLTMGVNANATTPYSAVWSIPMPRNRWITYLLDMRFAPQGWVELWVNGVKQWLREGTAPKTQRLPIGMIDQTNDSGLNSARLSVYFTKGAFDSVTAYFADFRVGSTRAQVDPGS